MKTEQVFIGYVLSFAWTFFVAGEEITANKGQQAQHERSSQLLVTRDLGGRGVLGRKKSKSDKLQQGIDSGSDNGDDHGGSGGGGGDSHYMSKTGKSSKRGPGRGNSGGGTPSSKSGKSSKKGEEVDPTMYYAAPFTCTNMCLDADGANFNTGLLDNAIQSCETEGMHSNTQQWMLIENNDMIQIESAAYKGKCIGVDYMPGDQVKQVRTMCHDGVLALLPCNDPATQWYFTGNELLSFFCWTRGVSSKMSVLYNAEEGMCDTELRSSSSNYSNGRNTDGMEDYHHTFMFITKDDMEMNYVPPPPDVDTDSPTESPSYTPTTSPTVSPSYTPTGSPFPTAPM